MSRRNGVTAENDDADHSAGVLKDLLSGFVAPFVLIAVVGWLQFDSLSDRWRLLAAAGAGFSVAGSVYAGKKLRRVNQRNIRDTAIRCRLTFDKEGRQDLAERIKATTGQAGEFSLESVASGTYRGVDLLVGELVVRTGSGKSRKTKRDVVVYAWDPRLQLPRFALQAEGKRVSLAARLVGLHDIDFVDNQKFSELYHLSSEQPEPTRKLFAGELVSMLGERDGWEIRGNDDAMLFCSRNRVSNSVNWLLDDTCRFFECFRNAAGREGLWNPSPEEAPDGVGNARTSKRQTSALAPQNYLTALEGPGIIKWTEVRTFLNLPPPRQVGRQMIRELVSVSSFVAVIVNIFCILFVIGGVIIVFGSIPQSQSRNNDWIIGMIFGLSMITISLGVMYTNYRERSRCKNLLRDGRITRAVIKNLRLTKDVSRGSEGYEADVRYVVGGRRFNQKTTVYGTHADYLRDAMKNQQPVSVLYHPQSPDRMVLTIQLTTNTKVTV